MFCYFFPGPLFVHFMLADGGSLLDGVCMCVCDANQELWAETGTRSQFGGFPNCIGWSLADFGVSHF